MRTQEEEKEKGPVYKMIVAYLFLFLNNKHMLWAHNGSVQMLPMSFSSRIRKLLTFLIADY